jgi:hypothetical protein
MSIDIRRLVHRLSYHEKTLECQLFITYLSLVFEACIYLNEEKPALSSGLRDGYANGEHTRSH